VEFVTAWNHAHVTHIVTSAAKGSKLGAWHYGESGTKFSQ